MESDDALNDRKADNGNTGTKSIEAELLSPSMTSPLRTGESRVVSCVKALLDNLLQGELLSTYVNHNDNSNNGNGNINYSTIVSSMESEDPILLGVQVCAILGNECILNVSAGKHGPLDLRRVERQTLFPMLDASGSLLALLAHRLVAEKVIDLEMPVKHYWPEFGG